MKVSSALRLLESPVNKENMFDSYSSTAESQENSHASAVVAKCGCSLFNSHKILTWGVHLWRPQGLQLVCGK